MNGAKIYVGNLSWNTNDDTLRQYGAVLDSIVMRDRETGRSRGFGFVTYGTEQEAAGAIQTANDQELDGRRIKVNLANARGSGGPVGGNAYGAQPGYAAGMGGGFPVFPAGYGGGAPYGGGFGGYQPPQGGAGGFGGDAAIPNPRIYLAHTLVQASTRKILPMGRPASSLPTKAAAGIPADTSWLPASRVHPVRTILAS
ncbi:hypothetical protein FRC10_010111 [Ceratobasidium sp. 414]|nr:hypothetical protein FRC10_010111 [Ceratobasidium sp. 414]